MNRTEESSFLNDLQHAVSEHPALSHCFLRRFAGSRLNREQLFDFATQHYLYAKNFSRNLAALISNVPDEHARMSLVLNMYEEIGEPSRLRDRLHLLLLQEGCVTTTQLAHAMEQVASANHAEGVVSHLIARGIVSRSVVARIMEENTARAHELTHPALFRRFLRALGLTDEVLMNQQPIAATTAFNLACSDIFRNGHWLEGMGAIGPGTECIVPQIYGKILQGIKRSECVSEADYVFWTVHVQCDEGHGRNIIEAVRPLLTSSLECEQVWRGAMNALDARSRWLDGLEQHVFGERQGTPAQADAQHSAQPAASEALAFSKRGDHVFRSLARRFPTANKWRLLIEQKLPDERFAAIRSAMLGYVSNVLGAPFVLEEADALKLLLRDRGRIVNYTPEGMLAPKREHTDSFNALHAAVAAAFFDFDIDSQVDGIDLPINVRMVYGAVDVTKPIPPFSSSKRHADVWAGVPSDAVVVVLPVLGDIENITIECAEMPQERELAAMRGMQDYDEGNDVPAARGYDDCAMKHGHLYLADVRLLHQTVRRKDSGVRLSVDFRFRSNDPEYRRMVRTNQHRGPDGIDTRVPYSRWLAIGKSQRLVVEETMADARAGKTKVSGAPVNTCRYEIVTAEEGKI
jgi:pyrroloquinoline quinone (PQQ) biosynthesis protein C